MTDTPEQEPAQKPEQDAKAGPAKTGVKVVRHSLRAVWLLVSVPVVVALLLAVLLIEKDLTAPSWVKNRVQERAALILGGGALSFGDITINVGRDLHPRVKLTDTVLRDANGAKLAEVAEIAGLMSPRGLLLERAALMQEVDLRGVVITLARASDGTVALAFDRDAAMMGTAPGVTALIAQTDAVFERPALQAMEQVRVSDLEVVFEDARADRTWRMFDGRLSLDLRADVMLMQGVFPLETQGAPSNIAFSFESPKGATTATAVFRASNIAARDIGTQLPAIRWLSAVDAPLSAEITTGIDANGDLLPLSGALDIGAGALQPNATAAPIRFDAARIALAYDPGTQIVQFPTLDLQSEHGAFQGRGQAIAQDMQDGVPAAFLGQFTFENITLSAPELYAAPLSFARADVDFRLKLAPFQFDIGQAVVTDPKVNLIASGQATASDTGWHAAFDLNTDTLSSAALFDLWPTSFKPRTRQWLGENVTGASFDDLTFALRIAPDRAPALGAGFALRDADVRFMKTLPIITGGTGYASINDHRFALSLDAGKIAAPTGGNIDVAGTSLVIEDLRLRNNTMTVNLKSDSSITAALSLLDQEPFRFLTKANRPVTLADGRARLQGDVTFPLGRKPAPGETAFDIAGVLRRVASAQIVPGRTLTGSEVAISVRNDELRFDGGVALDGVPMRGTYTLPIGAAANGRSTVVADVELSPRFLDAFNITLPPGAVAGTGQGQLRLDLARGQAPAFELTSNLRGITLALTPIGWSKGPRADGTLNVQGTLGPRPAIDRLEVGGGGLTARGSISFKQDGTLDAARFGTVRLGNWLNAPITLRGRGQGRPVGVEIAGGNIDLRRASFGGRQESGPMSIALDLLQISDGIGLTDFRGDFDGAGGFSGQFQGRVNGAAVVQGTVAPRNGRSAVRLVTDDAGGVVRAAGLINNAVGGSLDLTLLPTVAEGTFDGTLAVRNLRIKDAPAMAALLDAISVVGLLQQLDGQGLSFDAVDASFRLTPRQVILTESSAVGPGLGISLDGIYTLANKSVDFQGVISPFYLVNQIGSVLTRRGEGLIGFNFNIRGTADNPSVSVNPLSALTPGMFREIFRRAPPEVSQ